MRAAPLETSRVRRERRVHRVIGSVQFVGAKIDQCAIFSIWSASSRERCWSKRPTLTVRCGSASSVSERGDVCFMPWSFWQSLHHEAENSTRASPRSLASALVQRFWSSLASSASERSGTAYGCRTDVDVAVVASVFCSTHPSEKANALVNKKTTKRRALGRRPPWYLGRAFRGAEAIREGHRGSGFFDRSIDARDDVRV